jgi:hypothetical protein
MVFEQPQSYPQQIETIESYPVLMDTKKPQLSPCLKVPQVLEKKEENAVFHRCTRCLSTTTNLN